MHVAERIIRNKSKMRRVFLLRKLQYKLRSLKRSKPSNKIINKKIGNNFALETAIKEIINFLDCSFNGAENTDVGFCFEHLKKNLISFSNKVQQYRDKGKPIPISVINPCTKSMRNLYYTAKRNKLKLNCDDTWYKVGLNLIVLYDLDNITNQYT